MTGQRAGLVAAFALAAGLAGGVVLGRWLGERETARELWADAAAAGHAVPVLDLDGRPGFSWLPPCAEHWALVRARQRVEAAGLIVGEPEDALPVRTLRIGGRAVRVVGP